MLIPKLLKIAFSPNLHLISELPINKKESSYCKDLARLFFFLHIETGNWFFQFRIETEDEGLGVTGLFGHALELGCSEGSKNMVVNGADDNQEVFFAINVLMERCRVEEVEAVDKFGSFDFPVNFFLDGAHQQELLFVLFVEHFSGEEFQFFYRNRFLITLSLNCCLLLRFRLKLFFIKLCERFSLVSLGLSISSMQIICCRVDLDDCLIMVYKLFIFVFQLLNGLLFAFGQFFSELIQLNFQFFIFFKKLLFLVLPKFCLSLCPGIFFIPSFQLTFALV